MDKVTSFAEVWIEIGDSAPIQCYNVSLPSRKCGLKYSGAMPRKGMHMVTSFAEVWIEIRVKMDI